MKILACLIFASFPFAILASAIEPVVPEVGKDAALLKYEEFISQNDTQECIKQMASTDSCVAKMLFLSEEKVPVPKNMEELNSYCG